MDDLYLLDWQASALAAAADQQDWDRVASLDNEIAALLQTLQNQAINPPKRDALAKLQRCHRQVMEQARSVSRQLEHKMAQLLEQREGAQAYAAFMDEDNLRNE